MNASGKTTKTLVWILMGMLILGLGGFGVTNLGGSVRTVGAVGDKPITTQSYSRALQQMLQSQSSASGGTLSFAEAQAQQLDRIVLSQLIASRSLDYETARIGLSVGDDRLARQIVTTDAFQGIDGTFNREDYRFRLQQIGLTEAEYETIVREEMARGIVQSAMFSNIEPTPVYADTIINFLGEERDFTWALIDESTLEAPLEEATEEQLVAFHAENQSRYMTPDLRKITYALLTPEQMIEQVEVDETTLQQLFEERAAELNRPERRLVERLVFSSEEEASAAAGSIASGEKNFEAIVTERGLALSDVDMGDVTLAELDDAGEAVFTAESGAVVGPLPTSLGPALFRINGVLDAVVTEFEDVKDELRDEFAQSRARRLIDNERDTYEDLLAGGATLEEIAAETIMELGQIEWHSRADGGPSGYAAFREAADRITTDDFPEIIELEDGGLIALRLDAEEPAVAQPLNDVRDEVTADERQSRLTAALTAKAEALAADLGEGRAFASLGVTPRVESGLSRSEFLADAPASLIVDVFKLQNQGDSAVSGSGGIVALVQLDMIIAPNPDDPELASTRELLEDQYRNDLAQDVYNMFITDIQARTPVTLDEAAINAVNTQFQ
ncbi:peptidylprolyl isomerase [Lentibacter sp. XHP0401]|uniref:peptidylprolyl isomerase n=1 Tax=Lentibacter sp. XHP0401 TaxID=2984334 RepID=UPI0021E810BE|nr:peptidylprolyl isomerase [Lentibacter sp. XHP0401]MCV2892164.1 SurA N-terminal domain-containing protein [Lentibacter sp. XHP0401]